MRRFIAKLLLFLSLGFGCVLSVLLLVVLLNIKALEHCSISDDTRAIILGDSHTMWSIDDSEIKGLRNISLNAEAYTYSLRKLEHLLASNKNIDNVYIGFSYHNLSGYYNDYISGGYFRFFVGRYLALTTADDLLAAFIRVPQYSLDMIKRMIKDGLKSGLSKRCKLYGGFPQHSVDAIFSLDATEKRIQAQYFKQAELHTVSQPNLISLKKIIALCRAHNITVTMLNTPLHPSYQARVPQQYVTYYRDFLAQYQLASYDFSDLTLTDQQFMPDGDHTNTAGAALTTLKFKQYYEASQ